MASRPTQGTDDRHGEREWLSAEQEDLFRAMARLKSVEELEAFFRDLCTRSELEAMAHRWQVAKLLDAGKPYLEVAAEAGASTTTVTRVAQWLRNGEGGYRLALDRAKRARA
jgi:TrpR-related protein YerC/YecD